jgi:SNF2 family DNA or RNA helicase
MRLAKYCNHCNKRLEIKLKWNLDNGETVNFYRCGHLSLASRKFHKVPANLEFNSTDGKRTAYEYQKDGVKFGFKTNFNLLLADQMGLGKTQQAINMIRNACANGIELAPTLYIVRSSTVWQWIKENKRWLSEKPDGIFMIKGSNGIIPPGFQAYVISMDTFSRMVKVEINAYNGRVRTIAVHPELQALGIKCVVADECQSFKNVESARSRALVGFISSQNIQHKVFLSGTPIKNRADEYFVVLNLLDPENFPSLDSFRHDWLSQDAKGRWGRVNPYRQDDFRELISDYVLRREDSDVALQLPEFRRDFETVYIEDDSFKKIYNKEVEKLAILESSKESLSWMEVQENLMTLRRICGMAKVQFAAEYVDLFLETTPDEKIAIGVHHQAVRDMLYTIFEERGFAPLKLSGEDSTDKKEEIKNLFQKPEHRVLIINMLAGGVGMDGLQCCNNVLCLERQWNAVDEEQFEKRFHRNGQTKPVRANYLIAKGTIDDFFSAMVEEKREIFNETVGNDWNFASDGEMLKDLIHKTASSRI